MDEEQALEALSNVISALSETPFDLSLHEQHIQLALATGMDDQMRAARDTLTAYYACGDDVWVPVIEDKRSAADLETVDGALSVLTTYKRAEDDYLCTPLLYWIHGTRLFDLSSHPITSPAYRLLDRQIFPFLFLRRDTYPARRPFLNRVDSGGATRSSCPGRQPYHTGWLVPYPISSAFNVYNFSRDIYCGTRSATGSWKIFQPCCQMRG
jgi:hypothetical protein